MSIINYKPCISRGLTAQVMVRCITRCLRCGVVRPVGVNVLRNQLRLASGEIGIEAVLEKLGGGGVGYELLLVDQVVGCSRLQ